MFKENTKRFVVKQEFLKISGAECFLERVRLVLHEAERKVTILFYLDKMVINVISTHVTLQFGQGSPNFCP